MKTFRLVELVTMLEVSESGGPLTLQGEQAREFDTLARACEKAGAAFNSEGLRGLARRIAGRVGCPVVKVMAMRPGAVADAVTRHGLKPERVPCPR